MATMHWSDEWGLGLAEPDTDRRELVGLYNEMGLALKRGAPRSTLIAALTQLVDRAERAFDEEEKLMEAAGYPLWPEHRAEHRDFLQRMRGFEAALKEGRLAIDLPVLQFMRHWLVGHLTDSDGAFGRFLARNPAALATLALQTA